MFPSGPEADEITGPDPVLASELARVDQIARLLDARFRVFGLRFGWDGIVGLVPGVGDVLTAAPAAWIVWRAWKLGVPRSVLTRMGINWGLDFALGSVPIAGDLFDMAFKGNLRNAHLLRREIQAQIQAGNQSAGRQ